MTRGAAPVVLSVLDLVVLVVGSAPVDGSVPAPVVVDEEPPEEEVPEAEEGDEVRVVSVLDEDAVVPVVPVVPVVEVDVVAESASVSVSVSALVSSPHANNVATANVQPAMEGRRVARGFPIVH